MLEFRKAIAEDALAIAALHTLSWRNAYKGIMTQKYLAEEVENDRNQLWLQRFENAKDYFVWLALEQQKLVGFVCLIPDFEGTNEVLLDNIHVHPDVKGKGIGARLFKKALKISKGLRPDSRLYLWVFDENTGAIKFYEKLGGKLVETVYKDVPGANTAKVRKYCW